MSHMEIAHILRVLNGNDSSEFSGINDILDRREEFGITKYVANDYHYALFLGLVAYLDALAHIGRDRLLS